MQEFGDLPAVIERAKNAGVGVIINASFDLDSSKKAVELALAYENMYAAVGIHPHHADSMDDSAIKELKSLAKGPKVVAIGETGLDYFENPVTKEVQRRAYEKHLEIASELGLPLIFHGRNAGEDMLDSIKSKVPACRQARQSSKSKDGINGVFHCFSEDIEYARRVLDLGFYISFTGIITFKNADRMREVVRFVPLERIMVETDCPYLAPQVYRGQRNEPAYARIVAEKVAEIKGVSFEEVEKMTTDNARTLFKLPV